MAEAKMAVFIAMHNLSMSVANKLPQLVQTIAPDSDILKRGVKCASSKTTPLIKMIQEISKEKLIARKKSDPFIVSTDGPNDMDKTKLFPLVIRTISDSGVHSELLSVLS